MDKLAEYRRQYNNGELKEQDITFILDAWDAEVGEAKQELQVVTQDLYDEQQAPVEWGNCKRGCPPAYLNKKGYCSPACEMGAPRGQFVTLPEPSHAQHLSSNK